MPNFWLALLLILAFGVRLAWFPVGGLRSLGAPLSSGAAALDLARHLSCRPWRSEPATSPSMPARSGPG